MKDWDPTEDDPGTWRAELQAWRESERRARERQASARAALDVAEARASTLAGWLTRLTAAQQATAARADHLGDVAARIADAETAVVSLAEEIGDHDEARAIVTARLLGGPRTEVPLILLPLRVQTAWDGRTLAVRFYPDAAGVDSHDPRLSDHERAAGQAYWAMRAGGGSAEAHQAWENLLLFAPAPRAAWIARTTDPGRGPPAPTKSSAWDVPAHAELLPDRFAVIAYAAGEPVNTSPGGQAPCYITWGAQVGDPLAIDALQQPEGGAWMIDLTAAITAGMAVRLELPDDAPTVEELLVVGVRGGDPDVAGLLEAHAFASGLEILADGVPTNNSQELRAAYSPSHDAEVAAELLVGGGAVPADGSAGAQVADALGIARERLAAIAGAHADRRSLPDAAGLLVALAAGGAMPGLDDTETAALAPLLAPAGHAPAVRIGRQPYGLLPASAPVRWQPADGEVSSPLAPTLREWGWAHGAPVDRDPALPWAPAPAARRITRADDSQLRALLIEDPSSIAWAEGDAIAVEGLDGILGPGEGPKSPAAYLEALAAANDADLDTVAVMLPPALLPRLALAARRRVSAGQRDAVIAALRVLAAAAGDRPLLAREVAQHLDARSHRLDVWLTAAAWERLLRQRTHGEGNAVAVGAYGYLANVAPRTEPRSQGHVHAPSLGHAATAAVLRSGYLSQRRGAWATAVTEAREARDAASPGPDRDVAQAALDAAEAGLAGLRPLAPDREATIPLAVDLSSRRVRGARRVLAAVRDGQSLAAVLGYQFERDLADAGLQQYLAAFRKLTRFSTGTRLEALEEVRRNARAALRAAQQQLADLRVAVSKAQPPIDAAAAALAQAAAEENTAT